MSSSSYLELLKLKQSKLLKVINLFESGVGRRSDNVKSFCLSDNISFNRSKNTILKLPFIRVEVRDLKLKGFDKKLTKLKKLCCDKYLLCSAPECSFKCRFPSEMARHDVVHHSRMKPFKCRDCKYAANRKAFLKEHQLRMHSKSTGCKTAFVCEFDACNFRTTFNYLAVEHRRKHLKIKPFKCDLSDCGRSFVSQRYLQLHKMVHSEKKVFRCMQSNCKYATKSRSYLRRHQARHSSVRAFRCSHNNCSYAAKQKGNLQSHLQTHSKARPYKCDIKHCNYAGSSIQSLRLHRVVHSEVRPFKCDYKDCNYSCKYKINLKTHYCLHTNHRPFKCDYNNCTYAAIQKGNLVRHKMTHERKRVDKEKK